MGMLTLTRKIGQSILIKVPPTNKPEVIQIVTLGSNGADFKIGVDAPESCMIERQATVGLFNKRKPRPKQLDLFGGQK